MGVVWIAHNRVLDVAVAVKLAHQGNGPASSASTQRVLTEARLAAQLAHPAICRVIDFGTSEDGDPFVVSELLYGENLAEALARKKRLSAVRAVQTLLPILDGLAAAHAKNIVHRDVKPANIFLARETKNLVQPKLLDFGIARLMSVEPDLAELPSVFGTPCYMSPEQARGASDVDFRSDIWSLSVSLYELVTGVVPFIGDNYRATLEQVQSSHPPLITHYAAGDVQLARIVARGMQKDPKERWASAAELASELAQWLMLNGEEADACGQSLRSRIGDRAPVVAILTPAFGRPVEELLGPLPPKAVHATTVARQSPASTPTLVAARARPLGKLGIAASLSLLGGVAWVASQQKAEAAAPMAVVAPPAKTSFSASLAPVPAAAGASVAPAAALAPRSSEIRSRSALASAARPSPVKPAGAGLPAPRKPAVEAASRKAKKRTHDFGF